MTELSLSRILVILCLNNYRPHRLSTKKIKFNNYVSEYNSIFGLKVTKDIKDIFSFYQSHSIHTMFCQLGKQLANWD